MNELKKLCEQYFKASIEGEPIDDDLKHWIFEAAMEATLGKDVWEKMKQARKQAEIHRKKQEIEKLRKELDDATD